MRKILIGLLLSIVTITNFSFAGNYAYVDIDRVMNESIKGKKYKEELEAKLKFYQNKAADINSKISQMQKQLSSPSISDKAKEQKREELRQLARDLQNLESQANNELAKMKADAETNMVKDIRDIVMGIAKKNNYDIVFYGGLLSGVLYSNKNIDITDQVIKEYNTRK